MLVLHNLKSVYEIIAKKPGQALRFKKHLNMVRKLLKFMRFMILKDLKFLWTMLILF